jgi:hypothetical protein
LVQQIIDKINGQLQFTNSFFVSKKTTHEELINYFGHENISVTDFKNGWKNYTVRNVHLNDTYFIFTFYFENKILKPLHFILSDKNIIAGSWKDWSEKKVLEKRDYYNDWLTNEIGKAREFPWGTIESSYDRKGGFSDIVLNYK